MTRGADAPEEQGVAGGEGSAADAAPGARTVERTIEIDADVESVWQALTDARELTRWFPIEARVEPGAGGRIWMSWGDVYQDESAIEVWEPGSHLRTTFPIGPLGPLATDYHLQGRGGTTVLRVVTSGFGAGDEWDEYYEGVEAGWAFELTGLKHYLERHAGHDRVAAFAAVPCPRPYAPVWTRLTAADGLVPAEALGARQPGASFAFTTPDGDTFEGEVVLWDPPRQFVGTISNWNDALMRLELESGNAWAFMSTYGVDADRVRALERRWRDRLAKLIAG